MPTNADKTSDIADKAAASADNASDDIREQMRELRRETEHRLDRMAHQVRSYSSGMARDTQSQIREHPLSSVGGAFAVGMVVGCLLAGLGGMASRR